MNLNHDYVYDYERNTYIKVVQFLQVCLSIHCFGWKIIVETEIEKYLE